MFLYYPMLPIDYDVPPTLYRILNSLANFDAEVETKIPNLAEVTHSQIFDFTYPLTTHVNKDDFEILILNHFLMRRIGYETVTAWKIALNVRLNEIMPMYNKMFDMLDGWNLFNDGEVMERTTTDSGESSATSSSSTTNDNRYSDTPQGQLTAVQNGTYMSEYTYNTGSIENESSGEDSRETNETITRTPSDKIRIYKEFIENKESIMTMIFRDLDQLFYGLL